MTFQFQSDHFIPTLSGVFYIIHHISEETNEICVFDIGLCH